MGVSCRPSLRTTEVARAIRIAQPRTYRRRSLLTDCEECFAVRHFIDWTPFHKLGLQWLEVGLQGIEGRFRGVLKNVQGWCNVGQRYTAQGRSRASTRRPRLGRRPRFGAPAQTILL